MENYKPADIYVKAVEHLQGEPTSLRPALLYQAHMVRAWRDKLAAEFERLADRPLDLYPTWFAASNLAYRHAARLVKGEPGWPDNG